MVCNRLLEPEIHDDEVWGDPDHDSEDDEEYVTYLEANLNLRFKPGLFACPLVWETSIPLHSRLRETVRPQGSRGLQVTKMVLNTFAISNRRDMFVYSEKKNIFYFKIRDVISNSGAGNRSHNLDDSLGISR